MGKKKNKFKKSHHHHQAQPSSVKVSAPQAPEIVVESAQTTVVSPVEAEEKDALDKINRDLEHSQYSYVRRDVKKILLFILLMIILLVVAYFINTKTTIFQSFGNWIYKITNIQT
jgi:hypothetical protein